MKKRIDLKLLSVLCVIVLVFLALSTSAFSAKKEKVEGLITVEGGGTITLEGHVTITFDSGVVTKDTKIFIIYFGDGIYQFGPEIKIVDGETFTLYFENAEPGVTWIETFKQGEWVELECIDGYVVTDHFSRYRGAW